LRDDPAAHLRFDPPRTMAITRRPVGIGRALPLAVATGGVKTVA
jgi:hypothetical protein